MSYCADISERRGGIRAIVHSALAIKRHDKDPSAIFFGKAASRSYCNSRGKPIRMAWCARFSKRWVANNFSFVLNRLVGLNGNVRAYIHEQNHLDLFDFQVDENEGTEEDASGEVDVGKYLLADNRSVYSDEADNGKDLLDDNESVYRYPDEPAYYDLEEDKALEAIEAAATAEAEAARN
jgi:hypothetical protein